MNKEKNIHVICIKENGKLVRMSFSDVNKTAEECLTRVLKNLYR